MHWRGQEKLHPVVDVVFSVIVTGHIEFSFPSVAISRPFEIIKLIGGAISVENEVFEVPSHECAGI